MNFIHQLSLQEKLKIMINWNFSMYKLFDYLKKQCFETTIYRKPTFTGVLTNWNSDVPIQYKTASIVSMVNPALNICSTYKLLEHEFNEIRRFGLLNNYPLSFIDTIIGIKLSQHRNKTITKLATTTSSSSLSTTKTAITLIDDTNNDMKMDKSLIYQHEKERGHRMNWSNFQIV
ncbi:unnamed protein product, partial [Rotaria sp. Silwood2]